MSSEQNTTIRIIDIARLAGVSAGTVDRVLHNRGRVSPEKRVKVETILEEIHYEPNMAARFLASKRNYAFAVISPAFSDGDYWALVCAGIDRTAAELKRFNINVNYFKFNQYDRKSFLEAAQSFKSEKFDGALIATLFGEHVINLSKELDTIGIPYIYIDSEIAGQTNLAYFGGDSFGSGRIAAKLLLKEVGTAADIFIAHIKFKYNEISVQMKTRENGFMSYLKENSYSGTIHQVEINPDDHTAGRMALEHILKNSSNPTGGLVLNSRIYELVALLDEIEPSLKSKVRLIGHDAIERNVNALIEGKIAFILSQRPEFQGYNAMKALGNYFLYNQMPDKINHVPIDILIKENVEYYTNYKL